MPDPIMLKVGENVLTECRGMFFAVGFLYEDEGVPISARCCDIGHLMPWHVDACWRLRSGNIDGGTDGVA